MPQDDQINPIDPADKAREAAATDPAFAFNPASEDHDPFATLRLRRAPIVGGDRPGSAGQIERAWSAEVRGGRSMSKRTSDMLTLDVSTFPKIAETLIAMGLDGATVERMDLLDAFLLVNAMRAITGKTASLRLLTSHYRAAPATVTLDLPDNATAKEREKADAKAFYRSIMMDPDADNRDRMAARRAIDELEGLIVRSDTLNADDAAREMMDVLAELEDAAAVRDDNPLESDAKSVPMESDPVV